PNAFPISYDEPIKTTALPLCEHYSFINFSDDSNEYKLIISQSPDNISLTTIPSDSNSIISFNSVDTNEVKQRLTENDVPDSNYFSSFYPVDSNEVENILTREYKAIISFWISQGPLVTIQYDCVQQV
ncbi:8966_t:CDS:2, partial [Racocetra persica]